MFVKLVGSGELCLMECFPRHERLCRLSRSICFISFDKVDGLSV